MRLDTPPHATIGLNYFVVQPARFEKGAIPPQFCSPLMQWMYDEIDLDAKEHCFRHSILFSNGSQLELQAREVHVATLDTVYAPSNDKVTV